MSKPRRIRITHVHKMDGFYEGKETVIGREGMFEPSPSDESHGYYKGPFYPDSLTNEGDYWFFLGIKYIRI